MSKSRSGWNIGKATSENHEHFRSIVIGVLYAFDTEAELLSWLREYGFRIPFEPNKDQVGADLIRLLQQETDPLNLVLRAHLYLENLLEAILRRRFPNPELLLKNRDFTFSMKLDVLRAKNYLDVHSYNDIKKVNAIRNKFAHELHYDFAAVDFTSFSYCEYADELRIKDREVRLAVNLYLFKHVILWLLAQLTKRYSFLGEIRIAE